MFNLISTIALILGSAADGASTDYAIKRGNVEVDPVMVKMFGTNRPDAKTIFMRGSTVIATESVILLVAGHFNHTAGIVLGVALLCQAAFHFWATYHNYNSVRNV